jgi:hypothetical protein
MVFKREREREVGNNMCMYNERSSVFFLAPIMDYRSRGFKTHTLNGVTRRVRKQRGERIVFRGEECIRRDRHTRAQNKKSIAREMVYFMF